MQYKNDEIIPVKDFYRNIACWKYLTKGKKYEVIDSYGYCYTIIDDTGSEYSFPIKNFHTIQELREIKLNKLGI